MNNDNMRDDDNDTSLLEGAKPLDLDRDTGLALIDPLVKVALDRLAKDVGGEDVLRSAMPLEVCVTVTMRSDGRTISETTIRTEIEDLDYSVN